MLSQRTPEVPLVDLRAQYSRIAQEVDAAIRRVVASQVFVSGPETALFEEELAEFVGAREVVAVSSGTSALELALAAIGVGSGDEVVTVSHTFFATTEAIARLGARPVFVDVESETCTMDPVCVRNAITSRTRAIVPVHLYGHPSDTRAIAAAAPGIPIIEDAAQAIGAQYYGVPVGTHAVAATYSFFPGKNLGAYGDAGAVSTNEVTIGSIVRSLRDHGRSAKYEHDRVGTNARIDELQCAVLRAKLPHVSDWNAERRRLAHLYEERLAVTPLWLASSAPWAMSARHLFVVAHHRRDLLRELLAKQGIATGVHYPIPCHLQPAMRTSDPRLADKLAVTEGLAATVLSLPLYPELENEAVDRICEMLILGLSQT